MSSYLTFYGVPNLGRKEGKITKDTSAEPIGIVDFSRSDDVYRYFDENCNIAFCYNEVKYSDITEDDVNRVESDILSDIRSSEKRLVEYEKYAVNNPDYISEILSTKEYLEELYRTLHYTEFIGHIVREADSKYGSGFAKIVANIG